MPKIRCVGSGHSWTHLFADDGSWVLDTSGINDIVWSSDCPTQVPASFSVRKMCAFCVAVFVRQVVCFVLLLLKGSVLVYNVMFGGGARSVCCIGQVRMHKYTF